MTLGINNKYDNMGGDGYYLRTNNDSCLTQVSIDCDLQDGELTTLLNAMFNIMNSKGGVGISAPQVGLNVRVIIVNRLVMVNPIIVRRWGKLVPGVEECLSFPRLTLKISRNKFIKVSYEDATGKRRQRKFKFHDVAIVQHELNHLDGITIGG